MNGNVRSGNRPFFKRHLAAWFIVFAALVQAACSTGSGFPEREGFVDVTGGRVWYRIVGSGGATPIILLHGGPGSASDYLKPLEKIAADRPVIFYDQLGCGRSDRPDNRDLWRIERFVEELAQLRAALKLKEVHVYGHSWGTMLAVDYMLTQPPGVKGLILAGPCLSSRRWVEDANTLIEELPAGTRLAIRRYERGDISAASKDYEEAVVEYLKHHMCRLNPWPPELMTAFQMSNPEIYGIMWGVSEFHPTGNLKTYERVDRLNEIRVPTFFTAGRYDEATPGATAWYRSHVPDSSLRIFEKSAHLGMFEEPEAYVESIREFLKHIENR